MKHSDASTKYQSIVFDKLMHRRDYIRRYDRHQVRSYSFGSKKDAGQSADVDGHDNELSSPERIAKIVQNGFSRQPKETATAILDGISELDRIQLLLALQAKAKQANLDSRELEYVGDLVKSVQNSQTHQHLSRGEIANAIAYQRLLQRYSSHSHQPPSWKQLSRVMLASGLPFVGFGFCDNAVMLLAGDAIDSMIGFHLGITTLASAGLGNIAADVVGVSVTHQIKEHSRKISWAQPPRLSTIQQAMRSVRAAKMGGAAAGVTVGCILGMFPLLFTSPGFFVESPVEVE
eukprot:jgi/Picsp_1/2982/NSC_01206-R1_protein